MKHKGFTLTELLIALAVIGLLIAILMPVVLNLMPDKNALMAKRAYYTIRSVVSNMLNDDSCYPDLTQAPDKDRRIGFDDGYGYSNCKVWGGEENTEYIEKEDANKKFLKIFTDKFDFKDLDPEIEITGITPKEGATVEDCQDKTESDDKCDITKVEHPVFKTKDGMIWTVKEEKLNHDITKTDDEGNETTEVNSSPYIEFVIDVNGDDRPNCKSESDTSNDKCATTTDFDRFTVKIYASGKIDVVEDWALKAIDASYDITGKKN